MGRENDRSLRAQVTDQPANLYHLGRVETNRRLVEDQNLGFVHQRLGNADPLAVALGQVADDTTADLPQAAGFNGGADRAFAFRAGDVFCLGHKIQKALNRQVGIHRYPFGKIADQLFDLMGVADDIIVADAGPPRGWRKKAGQNAHGGAFPGPVWAQETDYLAAGNLKGDIVNGQDGTEALGHIFNADHTHRGITSQTA